MSVLRLEGVHGGDRRGRSERARGCLHGVSAEFEAGVHVVLGRPEDGTYALADFCNGRRRPQTGQVWLAGSNPMLDAGTRRRIGALEPDPQLPAARTVGQAVQWVKTWRQGAHAPVLRDLGLDGLTERSLNELSSAEYHGVALALAMAVPQPLMLSLHEPLAYLSAPVATRVRARLQEFRAAGVCVVITTSRTDWLNGHCDQAFVLCEGRLLPVTAAAGGGGATKLTLRLERDVGGGARALAMGLSGSPAVRGVNWQDGEQGPWVSVEVEELELAARAIAEACAELGVVVHAMEQSSPTLFGIRQRAVELKRSQGVAMLEPSGLQESMPKAPAVKEEPR